MRRILVSGIVLVSLWQGMTALPVAAQAVALTAEQQAKVTGKPVEVMSQRTERAQVFAQPDGSYKMEQTVEPVRARRGQGWVDIDTTVKLRQDGRVAPEATVTPTVYSGGGTAALAEFGSGTDQLVLRWPTALPRPELDGDKVVYREVMPGVDLQLETFKQGFGYALIVKNRAATRNPAVRNIRMPVEGLTVKTEKGVRTAVTKDGKALFKSPTSVVQDSWSDGEPGMRRGHSIITSTGDEIVITPDSKILDDPEAGFPIRIAEQWWPVGQYGWTSVFKEYPGDSYWNGANMGADRRARAGYSGTWEDPAVTVRSFYHFDLTSMRGKHVLGAELNLLGGWSSTCAEGDFWLAHSDGVGDGTTWNTQPGTGHSQARREAGFGRTGCGARWVGWDVGSDVAHSHHVAKTNYVTFRISGPESDQNGWRKWDTTSQGQPPKLIINFNQYPYTPGELTASPKPGCASAPNEPYITTTTPTIKARLDDPDGGRLRAVFEFWNAGGARLHEAVVGEQESGTQFQATAPATLYQNGSRIAWRVKARDPHGAESDWSRWCEISVDTTAPDRKPTVSSTDYPERVSSGAPGKSGRFFFDAAKLPDAAGFRYRVSGQGWNFVPAVNGSAAVDIAPTTADPIRLDVTIEDRAGNVGQDNEHDENLSNVRKYEIRVNGPTDPTGYWRLEGQSSDTEVRDSNGDHPGSFPAGKAGWTKGKAGKGLDFSGSADSYVSTRNGPALATTANFTVSAWVRLDTDPGSRWATAVSQDGGHVSRFALHYKGEDTRRWAFSMMSVDSTKPRVDSAIATEDRFLPRVGVWTHLSGVYDVSTKKIRLYVNGLLAGESTHDGYWGSQAPHSLQIGRGKWADFIGDYWPGAIDEVKVYDRALSDIPIDYGPSELDALAHTSLQEAVFAFDEGSGTTTYDATGNPRTATLPAQSWTAGRDGTTGFKIDSTYEGTDHVIAEGPAIRTDDSFTVSAWVKPAKLARGVRTVAAQSGGVMSGFLLQYRWPQGAEAPSWRFAMPDADNSAAPWPQVESPAPIYADEWTHLAAVYDESVAELRLYVNGAQSGAPQALSPRVWNAAGAFQIGRALYLGKNVDPWVGAIDEVRVYSGVRSAREINAEARSPLPDRSRLPAHGRFVDFRGDHRSGNGPMPVEYRREQTVGFYPPAGTAGTHMLYNCVTVGGSGVNGFTSRQPECEGHKSLGPLGPVYTTPPPGITTRKLIRCKVSAGWQEHFDSLSEDCEGHTVEGELGYLLPYTLLSRYQTFDGPADRRSDTGNTPALYRAQRDLVALRFGDATGMSPLYLCRSGTDTYASNDAACGGSGAEQLKALGWIWPQRPDDSAAQELFSCAEISATSERFESTDPDCEGQGVLGSLGFGLNPARITT
ncbi:LamG-like jellyroll fold domain-containing protein [Nonomuraea fuscirosea]|uniref:LamG-like jellyroll fold domain-containing protein n=1 Tax=Nonomuraea fuscirosea TaxID=1291556 RepID=UPI0033DB4BEA